MSNDSTIINQDETGPSASWLATPIWIAFGLILVTLATVGTVSYRSMEQFASNRWVTHTYIVIRQMKALLETSDEAVSAERFYVLTADQSRLEPVATARSTGARLMRSLASLTADNPEQQRRLVELQALLDAEFSLLEKVVATRTQLGRNSAISLIQAHNAWELTARIHHLAEAMIGTEDELLKERAHAEAASARLALRVLGIGAFAAFCLVAVAALYVRRTVAHLRHLTQLGSSGAASLRDLSQLCASRACCCSRSSTRWARA